MVSLSLVSMTYIVYMPMTSGGGGGGGGWGVGGCYLCFSERILKAFLGDIFGVLASTIAFLEWPLQPLQIYPKNAPKQPSRNIHLLIKTRGYIKVVLRKNIQPKRPPKNPPLIVPIPRPQITGFDDAMHKN